MPPPAPAAALIRPRSFTSSNSSSRSAAPAAASAAYSPTLWPTTTSARSELPAVTARYAASDAAISAGWVISVRES